MKRAAWALALVFVVAVGWAARGQLFPSETSRVQRALQQLAATVSFEPGEGNISAVRRISQVVDRFAPDASIEVDLLGVGTFHLNGREQIRESLMAARRLAKRLELRFYDPVIQIAADGSTAMVHLTATAEADAARNQGGFEALEFSLQLRKLDGRWVVQSVTTVPTLKQ